MEEPLVQVPDCGNAGSAVEDSRASTSKEVASPSIKMESIKINLSETGTQVFTQSEVSPVAGIEVAGNSSLDVASYHPLLLKLL